MTTSEGGRSPDQAPAAAAAEHRFRGRWSRQIRAVRWGLWAQARSAGAIPPGAMAEAFPSALDPSAREARRSENVIESPPESATAVDRGTAVDPGTAVDRGRDPWRDDILGLLARRAAGVAVVFPRAGDPRGLHDRNVIDLACEAGAAIRVIVNSDALITRSPIAPGPGAPMILIPMRSHENLHTWVLRSDQACGDSGTPLARLVEGFAVDTAVRDADRQLRIAILDAESVMSELGLRAGAPEYRDILDRATAKLANMHLPTGISSDRRSLLIRAAPIMWMCDLALADDSVTISQADQRLRHNALVDLDRVARQAVEAATAWAMTT